MGLKHLLVHVDSGERTEERLGLAVTLARRFGARLTGLFAELDQLGPSVVARRTPDHLREAAARAQLTFTARTSTAAVEAEWWDLGGAAHAEVISWTTLCCRYVDLAIFGQHQEEDGRLPADLVEQVVLDCGRPVLVVPSTGRYPDVGKRVLVGWNASAEAARAVNDAIPLMREAEFVSVLAFQDREVPGQAPVTLKADIVAHLAAHGIRAAYERAFRDEEGIGVVATLLNQGFESQADLTVVGVPGKGFPLRHAGGTVRELLRSMTNPLLLSH